MLLFSGVCFIIRKNIDLGDTLNKKSFLIITVMLFAILFAIATPLTYAKSSTSYNYAKAGDMLAATLSTDQVLAKAIGEDLSELEKEYLSNSDLKVKYSTSINISNIVAETVGNSVHFTLSPFDYVADNGERVFWLPYTVDGDNVSYENGLYHYTIENASEKSNDYVDIVYHSLLKVDSKDINKYINSAYEYALEVNDKLEGAETRYSQEYEVYLDEQAKYLDYLAALERYNEDLKAYNDYCKAQSDWETKSKLYNDYLKDLAEYEVKLEKYNAYKKELEVYKSKYNLYVAYQGKLHEYQKKLEEYEAATSSVEKQTAIYQLEILNYITKPVTELGRTLSGAILGDSVTKVLAEKESLVSVGNVEARAVDLASNATNNLRALINRYLQCSTDEEKYIFYILSKDDLTTNFTDLLVALDFIYQYPDYSMVRRIMAKENGVEKYEILLAQLYCICNALTEEPLPNYVIKYKGANKTYARYFDDSYTIGVSSSRTPRQILGEDFLEDKSLSEPLENGFPGLPEKPIAPDVVEEPQMPTTVVMPNVPKVVEAPGEAPAVVDMPISPVTVAEPIAPVPYQPTEREQAFKNSYLDKTLVERTPLEGEVYIEATTSTTKYFRNAKSVTVSFFDGVSDVPLWELKEVEIGSSIDYIGIYPTKTREGYTCTFAGWQDKDGNIIDCDRLQTDKSDLDLYPVFTDTPNSYYIHWVVNGITRTSEHFYDSIPVYDEGKLGTIEKIGSGVRQYRFMGWKSNGKTYSLGEELEKVSGDQKYEAIFEGSHVVTFMVDGIGKSQAVWDGELPIQPEIPQKAGTAYKYYEFVGWNKEVTNTFTDTTYSALFDSFYYATWNNNPLKISVTDNSYVLDCKSYSVKYEISNVLEKAFTENKGILFDCTDGEINLTSDNTQEFYDSGVTSIQLESVIQSTGGYKFILKLYDEDNNQVNLSSSVQVTLMGLELSDRSHLTALKNNIKKEVSFTVREQGLIVDVTPSIVYNISSLYHIGTFSSENAEISVNRTSAEVGDKITIKVRNLIDGAYVTGLYYVNGKGESEELSSYSFSMPASDVTIGILTEYYTYTITFKANDKTLFTKLYKYGEKVNSPSVPDIIAEEEGYIYKFIGWDKVVSVATADCEYTAVFEKQENGDVVPVPQGGKLDTVAKLFKPLLYTGIAVVALLVVLIPLLVVYKKRKKKKANKK